MQIEQYKDYDNKFDSNSNQFDKISNLKLDRHFSFDPYIELKPSIDFNRRSSLQNKQQNEEIIRKWLRNELTKLNFSPYDVRKVSDAIEIFENEYENKLLLKSRGIQILLEFEINPQSRFKYQ